MTIHAQDYSFSEGELKIRVDDQQLDWLDFMSQGRPSPPGIVRATTKFTTRLHDEHDGSGEEI